jgi:hypothetical protein
MYTVIALVLLAVVLFLAWSWRRGQAPAQHEPTRAGSPRTPRDDVARNADHVEPR